MKVIKAVFIGIFLSFPEPFIAMSDFSERKFEDAIEKPSAKRFAIPKTKIIEDESPAPITPATIAKVVTVPSIAP